MPEQWVQNGNWTHLSRWNIGTALQQLCRTWNYIEAICGKGTHLDDGTTWPDDMQSAWYLADQIALTLGAKAGVRLGSSTGGGSGFPGTFGYIYVTAAGYGVAGNSISITFEAGAGDDIVISVDEGAITVEFPTGATIAEIAAALNGDGAASALVQCVASENTEEPIDPVSETFLSGGLDPIDPETVRPTFPALTTWLKPDSSECIFPDTGDFAGFTFLGAGEYLDPLRENVLRLRAAIEAGFDGAPRPFDAVNGYVAGGPHTGYTATVEGQTAAWAIGHLAGACRDDGTVWAAISEGLAAFLDELGYGDEWVPVDNVLEADIYRQMFAAVNAYTRIRWDKRSTYPNLNRRPEAAWFGVPGTHIVPELWTTAYRQNQKGPRQWNGSAYVHSIPSSGAEAWEWTRGLYAELESDFGVPNTAMKWIADRWGAEGNGISIEVVIVQVEIEEDVFVPEPDHELTVQVTGSQILIELATDSEGVAITTANELIALMNETPNVRALVRTESMSLGNGLVPEMAPEFLEGGACSKSEASFLRVEASGAVNGLPECLVLISKAVDGDGSDVRLELRDTDKLNQGCVVAVVDDTKIVVSFSDRSGPVGIFYSPGTEATRGTFKLRVGSEVTDSIPYDFDGADILAALEPIYGTGNLDIIDAVPSAPGLQVDFIGALAGLPVDPILIEENHLERNEVQEVELEGSPSAGTFTLSYNGQTTAGIAYNAASGAVQSALEALSNIGAENVEVTGSAGGPWTIQFIGALKNQNLALMTGDFSGVTGATDILITLVCNGGTAGGAGNEVQLLTVTGSPTGGTFTVTYGGDTTSELEYNASAATLETALEGLSSIGSGNVEVTGSSGGPYTVTFIGALGGQSLGNLSTDGSGLTGGTDPDVEVEQVTDGSPGAGAILLIQDTDSKTGSHIAAAIEANPEADALVWAYGNSEFVPALAETSLSAKVDPVESTSWPFGWYASDGSAGAFALIGERRFLDRPFDLDFVKGTPFAAWIPVQAQVAVSALDYTEGQRLHVEGGVSDHAYDDTDYSTGGTDHDFRLEADITGDSFDAEFHLDNVPDAMPFNDPAPIETSWSARMDLNITSGLVICTDISALLPYEIQEVEP